MIAQVTGHAPGEFVLTLGDAHLYLNHLEQAAEQLKRTQRPFPRMRLNPEVRDVFGFDYKDFVLEGYDPHPAIKAAIETTERGDPFLLEVAVKEGYQFSRYGD